MKRSSLAAFVLTLAIGTATYAAVTIQVVPLTGPNINGSANTTDFLNNAQYGLQNNLSSYQAVGTAAPSAFNRITPPIDGYEMITSSFPTWLGQANPGTVFGPAYANEYGNRFFFGLRVLGNGTKITISSIDGTFASTDSGHIFNYSFAGVDAITAYSGSFPYIRVGVDYGPNGVLGGGDDTIYNTGSLNAHPVDEFDYVGLSNGLDALSTTELADDLAYFNAEGAFAISGSYLVHFADLTSASGSATFLVPEPASAALIVVLASAGFVRRRRI